jgi:signal peptidase II
LGGVLGNLTDRIFRQPGFLNGNVIDWIQIPHWPVFNLADSAITVAALIAFILSLRNISPITRVR